MRTFTLLFAVVVAVSAFARAEDVAPVQAKVLGNRVNVRAKPDSNAEVVGQLSASDVVEVLGREGDWARITPPIRLDLWVNREMVLDGTVIVDKVNVRSGAGINYAVVGELMRGTKVVPRGEFTDWLRISAPSSCVLYVRSDLLQFPEDVPSAAQPPVTLAPAPPQVSLPTNPVPMDVARVPVMIEAPAAPPIDPPADLDLLPVEHQGQVGEFRGILKPVGYLLNAPASFRLVMMKGRTAETVCYLRGNREQLRRLLESEMTVEGPAYWIARERSPVVMISRIRLHEGGP